MNKKIVGLLAVFLVILFTAPAFAAPADPASNNPSRHYPPGNYPPMGEPFWDDVPCNNFGQFLNLVRDYIFNGTLPEGFVQDYNPASWLH